MMIPAFSTVACPEWPIDTVLERAVRFGFAAVELRTFGDDSRGFACDPALTAPEKIRAIADKFGISVAQLGTSCAFGDPINPPLIGLVIGDQERGVRAARRAIDLAAMTECPLVRVFGFDIPASEPRRTGVARVAERLKKVADHAHRTGVRVVLENGGSFQRASDVAEVLDEVDSNLVGACLNFAVAQAAGDTPESAINVLDKRLFSAKIKDLRGGRPCPLGQGELPVRAAVAALAASGFSGPLIYEWDRAWTPGLDGPDVSLPHAAQTLFAMISEIGPARRSAEQRAEA